MEKRKNIKRKKAAGLAGWIERLKASPVAYHAVLIALTLVVIILG
jgi:hypothetical protein